MMRVLRLALCAASLLLALGVGGSAFALEPPTEAQLRQYKSDGTLAKRIAAAKAIGNDRVSPDLVSAWKAKSLASQGFYSLPTPPPNWRGGLGSTGTQNALAICIDFSDEPADVTTATISGRLDGVANASDPYYPYESLRGYYQRSSFNQLDLRVDTYGWYRPSVPRTSISQTAMGRENLIADALRYYDARGLDLSKYDNDHNGTVDFLMVYWMGDSGEWASFWWAYQTSWWATYLTVDGVRPDTYTWQWVSSGEQSTAIHETGHALGLPDLYDYDGGVGPDGGVGYFDMMDSANYDHNTFSKWMLDWRTPTIVSGSAPSAQLRPAATSGDSLLVMPGASVANMFSEAFVVENRQPTGNDKGMSYLTGTSPGLTIWHLDSRLNTYGTDFAWDNSETAHKYLAVEEADGLGEISRDLSFDVDDTWRTGSAFSPRSNPSSARYDGSTSGVVVDSITFAAGVASLRAYIEGLTDTTAPVTTATPTPANAFSGWNRTDVSVALSATDDSSGVVWTRYRLGESAEQTYTVGTPILFSTEGTTTLRYRSQDASGNTEATRTATVRIDKTPPTTPAPTLRDFYQAGLATVVPLAPTDGHSGVATTYWRVMPGGTFSAGATATINKPAGQYSLEYYSADIAGNVETTHVASFSVISDTTPPHTTSDAVASYDTSANITLTATDTQLGVQRTTWSLDGTTGSGRLVTTSKFGPHTLQFWSVDHASNTESPSTATFFVNDVTPPTVTSNAVSNYTDFAIIQLVAAEDANGSGLASLRWRLDAEATQTAVASRIAVTSSTGGDHVLRFWCVDKAGNSSAAQSAAFHIVAPTAFVIPRIPSPVTMGSAMTLSARIDTAAASGPAMGAPVWLEFSNSGGWSRATPETAYAAADGSFSFTFVPWKSATYRLRTAPGATIREGTSSQFVLGVLARVTRPSAPRSPRANRTFSVTGSIYPVSKRSAVVKWYRVSGSTKRFYRSQTVTVTSAGRWTAKRKLPKGYWAARVFYADTLKVTTTGAYRTFRVR
ncbi:MAG: M6 family metalloprotease domain-containing protein [Coriobacteriia bacterium]|nr:M6 family metalloprotease domain-containing protein [Coriobacteriia bacterium]